MNYLIRVVFIFSNVIAVSAQNSYYPSLDWGTYKINYTDTIIYDNEILYNEFNYKGKAPLFVQIWFPESEKTTNKYLRLGDLKFKAVPKELVKVYDILSARMDETLLRDGIESDSFTGEPVDYKNISTNEILQRIKLIKTKSTRSRLGSKLDFPVILYHHGSQGISYENFVMAEYFASKGYVFISANFHLPFPNTSFGLLPYELEMENKHNQSSAKTLINFAKSISTGKSVFFIGHSWGAQEGWCFLNEDTLVDAFVSMETTLEFKTDPVEIKEKWPYVFDALQTKKNKFSIPILLFAALEKTTNFHFFKGLSSEKMVYASYKKPFAHNSYASLYTIRYYIKDVIPQPDTDTLVSQIKGYSKHLKMMCSFFEHVQNKKEFQQIDFDVDFHFN